MIHYIFAIILFVHGIIHLMGYSRSFHFSEVKNMSQPIAKPIGLLWFAACILFVLAGIFYLTDKASWWILAISGLVISQIVIFTSWKDAKFGTIANILIIAFIIWLRFL